MPVHGVRQEPEQRPRPSVFYGALIGAILMLLMLPASRDFYLGIFYPSTNARLLNQIQDEVDGNLLVKPDTLETKSEWFLLACVRSSSGQKLLPEEWSSIYQLVSLGATQEPGNAFWKQAQAVAAEERGDKISACKLWISASKDSGWDDHQLGFLTRNLDSIRMNAGDFARLYAMKREHHILRIADFARNILARSYDKTDKSLDLKVANVLNGELIRKNSRTLAGMNAGIAIVDSAIQDPSGMGSGHHRLLVSRIQLVKAVSQSKLKDLSSKVEQAFLEDDGASALTSKEDSAQTVKIYSVIAVACQTLPGALLLSLLIALLPYLMSWVSRAIGLGDQRQLYLGSLIAAVIVLCVSLWFLPRLTALTAALFIVFGGTQVKNVRSRRPDRFGPLFTTYVSTLSLLLVLSQAVLALLRRGDLPISDSTRTTYFAATASFWLLLFLSIFLVSPLWAFAQRYPTSHVLRVGYLKVAKYSAVAALSLSILAGPLCIFVERQLTPTLQQLVSNEPFYYLTR